MKKLFCFLFFFFFLSVPVWAEEKTTDLVSHSKSAVLIDSDSGTILYKKNENERLAPASMTKIMSMLLIMEAIDYGNLKWDDEVLISENAASMGGSQVYVQAGETYKVVELLKGIAIASGNDVAVTKKQSLVISEEIII